MELKPGYKMTEAGVIPGDWEVNCIKNIAEIKTGGKNTQDSISGGKYPFFVRSQTVERINTYSFDGEAVLTAGDGVGTGKIFHYINGKFDYHQRVYKISNFSNQLNGYFFYLYFSNYFYDRIMQMTAKSSVDSVRMEMIADMPIALPPISEQQAIAAALSDVDELLSSLDQLIAKKKDIRLATMQELLTGKTRLPGFGGSWSRKRLEELAEINPENLSASTPSNYEFNYIALEDVSKGHLLKFSHYSFADSPVRARRIIKPKDILVSTVRPNLKSHLLATDNENNWICSTGFCIVRCHKNLVEPAYVYHSLFTDDIEYQIKLIVTGSNYPAINSSDVTNLKIYLPSSLAEQQAIASVLSDMDAEIEALEARRDKVRHIKAGMMQELLTGKTRLISSGERA